MTPTLDQACGKRGLMERGRLHPSDPPSAATLSRLASRESPVQMAGLRRQPIGTMRRGDLTRDRQVLETVPLVQLLASVDGVH